MSYSVLHSASATGSQSSLTIPATTAGSLLLFASSYDSSATITGVTGGGTWAQIGDQLDAGHGQRGATWYAPNSSAGVTSISFNPVIGCAVVYAEISGAATTTPLDTSNAALAFFTSSATANANASNNITPAGTGELIVSSIFDSSGGTPTFTAGTGFSVAVQVSAAGVGAAGIEFKSGGSGSQNATWTMSSGDSITVQIAAFLAGAGGGTAPFRPVVSRLQAVNTAASW